MRTNATVRVIIDFPDFSEKPVTMAVDLHPRWNECLHPIDWPKEPSDAVFCTEPVTAKRIMNEREYYARKLTGAIMDALAARDTENGYPRAALQSSGANHE